MTRARPFAATTLLAVVLVAVTQQWRASSAEAQGPAATTRQEPYRRGGQVPLQFPGPGRDDPDPGVDEIVIGWFGPGDPGHVEFGSMWRGALVAIEEENLAGGYRPARAMDSAPLTPVPFRLVPAWSETPWKAGVADLLEIVYGQRAWAVVGGVDGTTTHLAMQLALKARFVLLSPGSYDVTADHGNVPWLFSLPPADTDIARVLADAALRGPDPRVSILASTDHASHATLVALRREFDARRVTPAHVLEIEPATSVAADVDGALAPAVKDSAGVLVIVAPVATTARLVRTVRHAGFAGPILAGPAAARVTFGQEAGDAANGVQAPCAMTNDKAWQAFAGAYERRWHAEPDDAAADGYDAVRIVAAAVRQAGLNRPRIRDAVRGLAPWSGAAGAVRWDPLGRNQRAARPGRWANGRFACEDVARAR